MAIANWDELCCLLFAVILSLWICVCNRQQQHSTVWLVQRRFFIKIGYNIPSSLRHLSLLITNKSIKCAIATKRSNQKSQRLVLELQFPLLLLLLTQGHFLASLCWCYLISERLINFKLASGQFNKHCPLQLRNTLAIILHNTLSVLLAQWELAKAALNQHWYSNNNNNNNDFAWNPFKSVALRHKRNQIDHSTIVFNCLQRKPATTTRTHNPFKAALSSLSLIKSLRIDFVCGFGH